MREIYIRKMRYEDAYQKLDREIQSAFMEGETLVDVIHGIGEGKLKDMTFEYVRNNDFLKINDTSLYIQPNPGVTRIEIFAPSKQILKKYKNN
jgi:hypothetical protein